MLNNHATTIKLGSNSQTVQFNTPSSGMMQRSHPKSRFIKFDNGSNLAISIFSENPHTKDLRTSEYQSSKPAGFVTVLQVMVFADIKYLCEIVNNEDLIEETTQSK
jgi:hypothetical protein